MKASTKGSPVNDPWTLNRGRPGHQSVNFFSKNISARDRTDLHSWFATLILFNCCWYFPAFGENICCPRFTAMRFSWHTSLFNSRPLFKYFSQWLLCTRAWPSCHNKLEEIICIGSATWYLCFPFYLNNLTTSLMKTGQVRWASTF